MTSLDLVDSHKLDTKFFNDHVQHTAVHSDASRGMRRVTVVKNWFRVREVGRGSLGTVFLEKSREGKYRAVKEVAKDRRGITDYGRELIAMARLAKRDDLFVQFLGWYENDDYVYIAMEYLSRGDLRHYLDVERSESEAKAITRQLLEGLLVLHKDGFAHRNLKPENIHVVSTSPIWIKIGGFGLTKLARDGTAFRTEGGTLGYVAPEVGFDTSRETSEYTNAIDIWALGCITHEVLTQTLPFRGFRELLLYCSRPKLPRDTMLSKNISNSGIEFVERALAYPPEHRITAREALDLEWLWPEGEEAAGLEIEEDQTGPALPERPASPGGEVASGVSPPARGWHRVQKLGHGTFGAVFLERSEKGELRAMKEIAKGRDSQIDYKRELIAMAILAKHDALFVQLFGWYESDDYVHIAMEYLSHGDLRQYLEVERSEGEAKAITRQLLEGLSAIHQKGLAHRDLKPANILVVSTSPIWVKIGDFGLAKLAGDGTAFRTELGTRGYVAPEVGFDASRETSEYTNAIDIWALGCITHEMLTRTLPFRGWREVSLYCLHPKLPTNTMLSKNISMSGIEFVERVLAYPPERRIAAKKALELEWLRLEDEGVTGLETEGERPGPALPERSAPPAGEVAHGDSHSRPPTTFHRFDPQPKNQPLAAQITPSKPSRILTTQVPAASVAGHTSGPLLQWAWALCVALSVNRYFPAVAISVIWCLLFWALVPPLATAIGIQSFAIKLIFFAGTSYLVGKGALLFSLYIASKQKRS